jgi:UDP-N-acetylglucosamine 2-epimerase (non-hydrolysing)
MIDVFIGTKAQYIKTAPLLRLFAERGIPYRLIDSGQHAKTAADLRGFLGVKEPDAVLQDEGNIKTVSQAFRWFARNLLVTIFRPGVLRRRLFSPGAGPCIIHGDTPSTLLGLIMAKRAGKQVVHLEAGLRSFNLLKPFPEELIRIICMKLSDLLFAPSDWAEANLRKMGVKGRICNIGQNTNVEALYYAMERGSGGATPTAPYCVLTFHRVETIMNRQRILFILKMMQHLAQSTEIVFVQHDATIKKLADFGLLDSFVAIRRVTTKPLQSHADFVHLLDRAEFVITDGGSIQEECAYLGKPCLVMRSETERQEGLDGVVRLSNFDWNEVLQFVGTYKNLGAGGRIPNRNSSELVLSVLAERFRECAPAKPNDTQTLERKLNMVQEVDPRLGRLEGSNRSVPPRLPST